MFERGQCKASIEGKKIIIESDDPKNLLKSLGFTYTNEFKDDMIKEVKKNFKVNGTIEQMKDALEKKDTKESKLYLNILHEIKPQCKINGVYYNLYYYHPNMSLLQVSKTYDLDQIMKARGKEPQESEKNKKLLNKKEKLVQGGAASYDNMKKYYKINDKLSK
jgi:hypothetical protein